MTCLGLVCYMSWVKQWRKAMDLLQIFFITHIRENIQAQTEPGLVTRQEILPCNSSEY